MSPGGAVAVVGVPQWPQYCNAGGMSALHSGLVQRLRCCCLPLFLPFPMIGICLCCSCVCGCSSDECEGKEDDDCCGNVSWFCKHEYA